LLLIIPTIVWTSIGWETTLNKEEEQEIFNLEDEHKQPKKKEN
jgi:hypothetical protein